MKGHTRKHLYKRYMTEEADVHIWTNGGDFYTVEYLKIHTTGDVISEHRRSFRGPKAHNRAMVYAQSLA